MEMNNLRGTDEYANLADEIRNAARGQRIVYVPNTGNWGDGLIHFGTLQFLRYYKIPYVAVSRRVLTFLVGKTRAIESVLGRRVLVSGGGGAWCNNYSSSRNFVEKYAPLFGRTIVLPSTFELSEIPSDKGRITYFRRDKYESADRVESKFCHDMAFFLDYSNSQLNGRDRNTGQRKSIGNFFRTDCESLGYAVPADNIDLSLLGSDQTKPLELFRHLQGYNQIRTDRLHVAIASCMLSLPCELFPGNYFKSSAVYRSSIEPNYQNCYLRLLEKPPL